MDPNCTAFRYNPKTKFGFLCKEFDPKHTNKISRYDADEWKLCEFDTGKGISCIAKNMMKLKFFSKTVFIIDISSLYIYRLQKQWRI